MAPYSCTVLTCTTVHGHPSLFFIFIFLSFCHFLGSSHGTWRFPGQGSNRSFSHQPTPEPHSKAGCLTQGLNPQPHGSQSHSLTTVPRRELQGWLFLRLAGENLFPSSPLASRGLLDIFGIFFSLLMLMSAFLFTWYYPYDHVQIAPFDKNTSHIGLGSILMTSS